MIRVAVMKRTFVALSFFRDGDVDELGDRSHVSKGA